MNVFTARCGCGAIVRLPNLKARAKCEACARRANQAIGSESPPTAEGPGDRITYTPWLAPEFERAAQRVRELRKEPVIHERRENVERVGAALSRHMWVHSVVPVEIRDMLVFRVRMNCDDSDDAARQNVRNAAVLAAGSWTGWAILFDEPVIAPERPVGWHDRVTPEALADLKKSWVPHGRAVRVERATPEAIKIGGEVFEVLRCTGGKLSQLALYLGLKRETTYVAVTCPDGYVVRSTQRETDAELRERCLTVLRASAHT